MILCCCFSLFLPPDWILNLLPRTRQEYVFIFSCMLHINCLVNHFKERPGRFFLWVLLVGSSVVEEDETKINEVMDEPCKHFRELCLNMGKITSQLWKLSSWGDFHNWKGWECFFTWPSSSQTNTYRNMSIIFLEIYSENCFLYDYRNFFQVMCVSMAERNHSFCPWRVLKPIHDLKIFFSCLLLLYLNLTLTLLLQHFKNTL